MSRTPVFLSHLRVRFVPAQSLTAQLISALVIAAGLLAGTTGSAHAFAPPQQTASVDSAGGSFEKVVLVDEATDPMELQVAEDGRVFMTGPAEEVFTGEWPTE